jgi:cobalamin biosynthesis Mg chelatase CobN
MATQEDRLIRGPSPEPYSVSVVESSAQSTERMIEVLREYTQKIEYADNQIQEHRTKARQRVVNVSLTLAIGTVVTFSQSPLLVTSRQEPLFWIGLVVLGIAWLSSSLALVWAEVRRTRDARHDAEAMAKRLDPFLSRLIEVHQRVERDEVRRLELSLRLTEAQNSIDRILNASDGKFGAPMHGFAWFYSGTIR